MTIFILPAFWLDNSLKAQALTWEEFSTSLSSTMSSGQGLSIIGILGLILIILIVCLLILVLSMNRFQKKNMKRLVHESYKRTWSDNTIKMPNGETIQKREYYRFNTDARLHWKKIDNLLYSTDQNYNIDQLCDISAGGMNFLTLENLEIGAKLKVLFNFGDEDPFLLDAIVVRSEKYVEEPAEEEKPASGAEEHVEEQHITEETPADSGEEYVTEDTSADGGEEYVTEDTPDDDVTPPLYKIGIKFHRILEEERDIIISWIMKSQRALFMANETTASADDGKEEQSPASETLNI
ncbi:MAG: PilZ domain-containing protein [Syntrophomonadaceae bacterium]|jgi:preprotein translocase subunit Sss1|nr:PilZ domain-containing protein [Syntrophomonadaceae bacterium]